MNRDIRTEILNSKKFSGTLLHYHQYLLPETINIHIYVYNI